MQIAAQATAQTEADVATQSDEFAVEVNEARCTNGGPTSHIVKNQLSQRLWTVLLLPQLRVWMLMNECLR